jgi:hypothetical protein
VCAPKIPGCPVTGQGFAECPGTLHGPKGGGGGGEMMGVLVAHGLGSPGGSGGGHAGDVPLVGTTGMLTTPHSGCC